MVAPEIDNSDPLSPIQLKALMGEYSSLLRIDQPFLITDETLQACYHSLSQTPFLLARVRQEERRQYREERCSDLELIEFQTGWHVLRVTNHANTDISEMSEDTRNNLFLCELYTRSELFPFFQPRETAITALDGIGFIDAGNYRWIV